MKKYILILLLAVFTFSCETAPKEVELGPAPGYLATCLLYTSPSPRDAHESRMPSSA